MRLEECVAWLKATAKRVADQKEYLTELDQAIGDGDHGINLARGYQEAVSKMEKSTYADIGALLQDVGMVLLSKVGGASGPLLGTAFMKAAAPLKGKQEAGAADWALALEEAVKGIKLRGKAEVGNKTMLDLWEPLALYVKENQAALDLDALLTFAQEQVEKTKELVAIKGRAAYLGPRAIGHLDPGAVSSLYLIETLHATLTGREA